MDTPGEMIRKHHRELAMEMAQHVATLASAPSESAIAALVQFLTQELLPHARGEEQALYPAVEPLIKAHGTATATMVIDHEAIEGYIRRIADMARARAQATGEARATYDAQLAQLALQLQAIFELHRSKEERVYLPLLEQHLPPAEQERVIAAIHALEGSAGGAGAAPETVLDVRQIIPRERHPLIFATFDRLHPGEAFILVNDHDPKPLYYQFSFERSGQFTWEYLEQGPEVWRVRIGRTA